VRKFWDIKILKITMLDIVDEELVMN